MLSGGVGVDGAEVGGGEGMLTESIYEDAADFRYPGADFSGANPQQIFAELTVYVEFGYHQSERYMTETIVPGHDGLWIAAYSSLRRLQLARGNDEIEYSAILGRWVLVHKPSSAGVWFDPCFRGGRPILVPIPHMEWGL